MFVHLLLLLLYDAVCEIRKLEQSGCSSFSLLSVAVVKNNSYIFSMALRHRDIGTQTLETGRQNNGDIYCYTSGTACLKRLLLTAVPKGSQQSVQWVVQHFVLLQK